MHQDRHWNLPIKIHSKLINIIYCEGMRIEEAVDDDVDIENWDYSSSDDPDICDLILTTDGGDLQAVRAIRKKYGYLHHLPYG